jgi:hypothetical protein
MTGDTGAIAVTCEGGRVEASVEQAGTVLPSTLVCYAVATAERRDPLVLPPLYDTLDTDALDALFDVETSGVPLTVRFRYAERRVTVRRPDGALAVTVGRPDESTQSGDAD